MKAYVFFFFLVITANGYGNTVVYDNLTSYPVANQSKMAIQWANSAKEVQDGNHALIYGFAPTSARLQTVTQKGKITLAVPQQAQYFRVLVWSKSQSEGDPDLNTSWVEIIPDKTYTLKQDYLIPTALMAGTGC